MGGCRLAAAACAVAILACGPPEAPLRQAPVFDAPAAERVNDVAVFERSEVLRWPLGQAGEGWRSWPEAPTPQTRPGFTTVPPRETPLQLRKEADLETAAFHSVAVSLARPTDLRWMRACFKLRERDERACQSVHATLAHQQGLEPFRFWPARMPGWQGRLAELIVIVGPAEKPVNVAHVSFETWRVEPTALEHAWRVGLAGEHHLDERVALLSRIGQAFRRRVQVPPSGGTLEVGVGAWPLRPTDLHARVLVRTSTGSRVLAEQVLPASRISTKRGQPKANLVAWYDLEFDLSRWAGSAVDLVLETRASEAHPEAAALVAWSGFRLRSPPRSERLNFVLVSIDTLRADHLSLYGYRRSTSPNLDALAQRCGVVFERAIAAAPWTLPSHLSIFTGLDPISHRVNHVRRAPETLVTLAERLREAGYQTSAVTGGGFTSSEYGLSQGFDRYLEAGRIHGPDEPARNVDAALRELTRVSGRGPFLLFLHTFDVHEPYRARPPHAARFAGTELPLERLGKVRRSPSPHPSGARIDRLPIWVDEGTARADAPRIEDPRELGHYVDLYDAGIAHTDAELARLFEWLRTSEAGARTVLVVTSDHGEALGEGGHYAHGLPSEANLHVPLVLSLPGCRQAGTRVTSQVRLVDIAPTFLDLAGLPAPAGADGRSLLPILDGSESGSREAWAWAATTNRGVVLYTRDHLKYVLQASPWHPLPHEDELYDLRRDPEARRNVAGERPGEEPLRARVLQRLRESLKEPLLVIAAGDAPLRAHFANGPYHDSVKSARRSAARLTWHGSRSFELELPPGERAELMLLEGLKGDLSVNVAGYEEPLEVPSGSETVWAARPGSKGWETLPACPPEGPRLCLFPGVEAPAARAGAELEAQLRALGYLD